MKFGKATINDIEQLTDLRAAYIQEDLGDVDAADFDAMREFLPGYYAAHLGKDLYVYITRNDDGEIVSCAFLLIVEKPASPALSCDEGKIVVWRIGGLSEGTLQVLSEKEVVIY